jgi:NAD+ synthase (glutamine-hydrolysing)
MSRALALLTRRRPPSYHTHMQENLEQYGFIRVAAALPAVKPAAVEFNCAETGQLMNSAPGAGVEITVFPELGLSGYTCADLFQQERLLKDAEEGAAELVRQSGELSGVFVVGAPVRRRGRLFNCALVLAGGRLIGIVPKTVIPNSREFYEARWFSSGAAETGEAEYAGRRAPFGTDLIFSLPRPGGAVTFGIEICEDLWAVSPPSSGLSSAGAQLILNPSASNELVGKASYRQELIRQQSARCLGAYIYASAGAGESTTDTVYGGHGLIAENGVILAESERFRRRGRLLTADIDVEFLEHERINSSTFSQSANLSSRGYRYIDSLPQSTAVSVTDLLRPLARNPFVPSASTDLEERCREIFAIQSAGLASRLLHIGCSRAVIGVSGGLDSTLALLVTVEAFRELELDPAGIRAYSLPGFGTSTRTRTNVEKLTQALNIPLETVDIGKASLLQLKDLGHSGKPEDTAYENVQARQRTMFLMNKSNMLGGIVIGTGDLSELALGWCTYNGDHMSMYAVNSGVPKTLVRFLVNYAAQRWAGDEAAAVLRDIVDTPISPELLPPDAEGAISQMTEETIGPYELHDFFLYHAVRCGSAPAKVFFLARMAFGEYEEAVLLKWLESFYRRFFSQQFKRSCLPDGPKVGTISLSPRGDWRMPSDADASAWLNEIRALRGE